MPPKRMLVVYGIDVGYQFTKIAASYPPKDGKSPYPRASTCSLPGEETDMLPTTVDFQEKCVIIGQSAGSSAPGNGVTNPDISTDSEAAAEATPESELKDRHRWFKLAALSSTGEESARRAHSKRACKPADSALAVMEVFLVELRRRVRQIHDRTASCSKDAIPSWHEADIDFIFSVPSIVGESGARVLEATARLAGFASSDNRHRVPSIQLTEAEAAGVHAVTSMEDLVSMGDTALVIDVGGGTSDLSILTLTGDDQWKLDTNFLQPVSSDRLGGAQIDKVIGDKMTECLKAVVKPSTTPQNIQNEVDRLQSNAEYHQSKLSCESWTQATKLPAAKDVLVQQQSADLEGVGVCLTGPKLAISVQARLFARLLDTQIHGTLQTPGILSLAVAMRDDLAVRSPSQSRQHCKANNLPRHIKGDVTKPDTLDFVFFAGGLGTAQRLRDAVTCALAANPNDFRVQHTTAKTQYEPLPRAQHAVALGLVEYWIKKLAEDTPEGGFIFKTWLKRGARHSDLGGPKSTM